MFANFSRLPMSTKCSWRAWAKHVPKLNVSSLSSNTVQGSLEHSLSFLNGSGLFIPKHVLKNVTRMVFRIVF